MDACTEGVGDDREVHVMHAPGVWEAALGGSKSHATVVAFCQDLGAPTSTLNVTLFVRFPLPQPNG